MNDANFSLKDMIIEVRNEQKVSNEAHIKMAITLESMELQMKKFLAVAEDHETRIKDVEGFKGKAMVIYGIIVIVFTVFVNKVLASINF
jgi:hypothetical protein